MEIKNVGICAAPNWISKRQNSKGLEVVPHDSPVQVSNLANAISSLSENIRVIAIERINGRVEMCDRTDALRSCVGESSDHGIKGRFYIALTKKGQICWANFRNRSRLSRKRWSSEGRSGGGRS